MKDSFLLAQILKISLPQNGIDISEEYENSEYYPIEDRIIIAGTEGTKEAYFGLAHEMRHKWQWDTDRDFYFSNYLELEQTSAEKYRNQRAEIDANAFAMIMCCRFKDYLVYFATYSIEARKKIFDHAQELAQIYNIDLPWENIYEMYL